MRMMGMKDAAYWLSWFVFYFVQVVYVTAVLTIINSLLILKYS